MAKDPVTISVVVPCHNDELYIEECLNALSNQSLKPSEIIVCDDASADKTLEIVRVWQSGHPELPVTIVAHDDHVGIPRNFNSGLVAASGDYVSMVAADDYWKPRKLEREYTLIREKAVSWAYSKVELRVDRAGGNDVCRSFRGTNGDYEGDIFTAVVHRQVSPRCFLIERRVLMETGLFDESIGMYEDWDLKMRLAKRFPIAHVQEANVIYRQHGGGEHHAPMYRHMGEISKVLRKNKSLIPGDGAAVWREVMQAFWPENSMSNELDRAAREATVASLDIPYDPVSIKSNGEGLIFLVSLPRSGSTMLQRVLGSHPDIHTTGEPWVMLHPLYALKHTGLEAVYDAKTCRRALGDFMEALPAGEKGYYTAVRKMACSLYRQATVGAGKSRFLDKTPRYFNILPELMQVFPKAKYVLLLRNPIAVLASVLDTWFNRNIKAYESSSHFRDMMEGPRLLAEAIETFGDNLIVTRYEDVVADTQAEVRRLCKFLELPFFNPMLEYGARPAPSGVFGDPRKINVHNAPVEDYVETWKGLLSSDDIRLYATRYLDSIGDDVLSRLGYSLTTLSSQLGACPRPAASESGKVEAGLTASLVSAGEAAYLAGDIKKAEANFLNAYAMDSTDIVACNNLVVLYWGSGNMEQALRYLDEAMQLDSTNREVVVNGGQILCAYGYKADAAGLYKAYLAIHQDDKEVRALYEQAAITVVTDEVTLSGNTEQTENESKAASEGCDGILVTAIVSTYNSERYIEGCLQDLMLQTIADRLEIIVVDSGSQQNERAVVERYQKEYANIRYFRTDERETIYAAWNKAIRESRGKYLTNANTDDRHRPDAFERMLAELEMNPHVSLVYADSAVTRMPNAGFDQAPVEGFFRWPEFDAHHLFSVCYIGPQPMWRRSLHEKYGDFDAQMKVAGDYDFWLRMATAETFRHIPEVLGLYLLSSGSIEHAFPAAGAGESEAARRRNWPDAWGQRPALSPGYLVPADQLADVSQGEHAQAPLISIIMPTKDRLQMLGRALDSVVAQTYRNWELIVVNDGGESIHTVTGGRDPSDRIRRIDFDRSQAQAVARNTALAVAKGEIICYLDDDDVYLPHHLETIVRELSEQGRAFIYTDAVVVKEKLVDGAGKEVGRSNPYAHHEYSRERLLVNNYIPINTWAHKRVCLDAIGMFDRSLSCYEDWEFLLRLSERYDFHHIKQTTVEVRHRVDQVDNVSRRRLADTADAYRTIYARHGKGLAEDLLAERETVLQTLVDNIDAWTSGGEGSEITDAETAPENSYQKWLLRHELSDRDIARITRHMMTDWTIQPSVHLIMTHLSGQEKALADTLDSLISQLYGGWGLSVVSCSPCPDPIFEEMDMLEWRQVEGDLMQGVNAVVTESGADWIGRLDAGSSLEPHLLYRHVDYLHQHPEWRLVYMDEDRIGAGGERYDPVFKPEFNLELLRAMPYMGRFLLLEREALIAAGGYSQNPGTDAYDVVFRFVEHFGVEVIGHIPDVLIHQQDRFQLARDEQAISEHRRQCIVAHLQRCAIAADVQPGSVFGSYFVDYACNDKPPVDIIVPVSGRPESLGLFLDSLSSMTDYPDFRVRLLIRDDVELSAELLSHQCCDVSTYSRSESQWKKLLELVRGSKEHVLLMNPGSIAIQPNWLERLVAQFQNKDVAVVAPRLVSADKKVVGGGLILGAGPYSIGMVAYGGLSLEDTGYMGRAQVAQEMSAVSVSCMLVRKSVFESVGGVSEDLKIPLSQAVDYCLRVREAGGKIIWTPHSTLMYLGEDQSALDGVDIDEAVTSESEAVCRRALAALASDPGYNPNLKLAGKRFSVDDSFSPRLTHNNDSLHRVVGLGAGSIGSWKFRIQQPLNVLHGEGVTSSLVLPFSKGLVQLPSLAELKRLQVDSLLMHNAMHDPYMDAMEAYKRVNQTFIVFGQDDLMYAMPPKNPFSKTIYKDVKKRVRRCLGIADRVIVTTQALAEELRSMADDIRVVPNYLDEAVWGGLQSQRGVSDKPRVGWAGAQQHLGDLELLEEVVRETADEVDWVFFGMCPEFLQPYVKEIHNPVTFGKYPQKLATLNLDLAVAPLEHHRFNECKSNLRLLEYGVLGWPVIASDVAPYREGPLCRVHNQPRAWIKAIRERIHDLDATRQEGDVLRDWVRENWLLQQHLDDWLTALDPASDSRLRNSAQGRAAGR